MGMKPRHRRNSRERDVLLSSKYIRAAADSRKDSLRLAGIEPAPALLEAITTFIDLLLRWNRKINLTTITDPAEIVTRNFAESFHAARWLTAQQGRLIDVGSGAGFPGLALKLVLPRWQVVLLEPSRKKSAFLAEAVRTLGLRDVVVESCRWDESPVPKASANAITSRALGGYPDLARWAQERLLLGGRLILWVGARDAAELTRMTGWRWDERPIPETRERVLLVGSRE